MTVVGRPSETLGFGAAGSVVLPCEGEDCLPEDVPTVLTSGFIVSSGLMVTAGTLVDSRRRELAVRVRTRW